MGPRLPFLLAALAAGCSSGLPPLPAEPDRPPAPVAGQGEPEPPPGTTGPVEGQAPADELAQGRNGDAILPGVVLLEPALDAESGTATFGVRNDAGRDLPDFILAVIFAVGRSDGGGGPPLPRFETLEAPLRAGETRRFRVTLSARRADERPAAFRVVAGLPEVLAAGGEGMPGTTFLGGLLECVRLEADLTGPHRQVTVGLAPRGAAARGAALPALEGQLLLGRAGGLVFAGPWILLPRGESAAGAVRRIQWNLEGAPSLAGCDLFLRVREKR